MKKLMLIAGLIALSVSKAWCVPQVLNFQGRLIEGGVAVTGSRDTTFRIYDAASGGVAVFAEAHVGAGAVVAAGGIFNVLIGALTPGGIPLSVFNGGDKFVEVQVGATVLPRQRISSLGYAFMAAQAQSLAPGANVQLEIVSVATMTAEHLVATTLRAQDGRFLGELTIGSGTVHVTGAAGGFGNAITFTQVGAQAAPQIRTAAAGSQGLAAATGGLPLAINAGLGGTLNLNTISTGPVNISLNAASNVGIGTPAPSSKLHVAAPAATAGNVLVVSTGTSVMFQVLGTGEVIAAKFTGDGSGLTNVIATDTTKVAKTGDTMTGALNMNNAAINLSGGAANIISQASVTASAFFGDGSGLTNVSASQIAAGNVTPGTFVAGVNLPAASVLVGALGADVVASSIALNAVQDGSIVSMSASKLTGTIPSANLGNAVLKTGDTMTGSLTAPAFFGNGDLTPENCSS